MSSGKQVAAVLNRLLDGLGNCAVKGDHVALWTLCEAMTMAPQPMKTHIAKRLLDLEINNGVETPMQYRLEVADAVQGIPTLADHIEPFRFAVVKGSGETDEDNNNQPPPKLRVVKE